MCQLTFINTGNPEINRLLSVQQMLINCEFQNKDGYGIFANGETLFKSERNPRLVSNFGKVIADRIKSADPLMCHVRAATITPGKNIKEINAKNSHPFAFSNIILAHNGSLEPKDKDMVSKYKILDGKIDSEIFGFFLNKEYTKNPGKPFVDVFNEVSSKFTGKFAFLIFDKIQGDFYVIRGWNAKLYITYLETADKKHKYDYVINTEDTALEKNFVYSLQLIQFLYDLELNYSKPELLHTETIYKAEENGLLEVGKTKENFPVYTQERITNTGNVVYSGFRENQSHFKVSLVNFAKNESEILLKFMERTALSPEEINRILMVSYGVNLLSLTEADFKMFMDGITPILLDKTSEPKTEIWKKIIRKANGIINIYNTYNLKFPYMYNNMKRIEEVYDSLVTKEKLIQ